jgi:hypothetical protein
MPESSDKSSWFLFFEGLDAESRSFAKKLDELKFFYYLYGIWDGTSVAAGTLIYYFNIVYADSAKSSNDVMHDWMETPAGAAVAATETITLVTFSLLANIFDDNDKNAFKRYIAIAWPYCRDSLKGVKNAYKGVRNSLQAVGMLSGHDLQYMIVPLGLALGAISVLNRVWVRKYVKEPRMAMMKENSRLLLEIQGTALHLLSELPQADEMPSYKNSYILVAETLYYIDQDGSCDPVTIQDNTLFKDHISALNPNKAATLKLFLSNSEIKTLITDNGDYVTPIGGYDKYYCEAVRKNRVGRQSTLIKNAGLLSAAYGGVVDGLYLYMGALGLTYLSPPVFMAMAVCSAVFALMCVTTRIYEEVDFQRKLQATEAKIEVALCCKEIELIVGRLKRVYSPIFCPEDAEALGALYTELQQSDNPEIKEQVVELGILLNTMSSLAEQKLAQSYIEAKQAYIAKLKEIYEKEIIFKVDDLKAKRKKLRSLVISSGSLTVFAGLRNGLAAYGAITSLMFAVATINAIFLIPFSATFLIAGVTLGMACVIAFVIQAFIRSSLEPLPSADLDASNGLIMLLHSLKQNLNGLATRIEPQDVEPGLVKNAVLEGMDVVLPPRSYLTDWLETVRSFGSGLAKGPKLLELVISMWRGLSAQEPGDHAPLCFQVALLSAVVQALIFAFRALAKGVGRDTPDVIKSLDRVKPPETATSDDSNRDSPVVGSDTSFMLCELSAVSEDKASDDSGYETPQLETSKQSLYAPASGHGLFQSIAAPTPQELHETMSMQFCSSGAH